MSDADERNSDSDSDGVPDYLDTDSDNDGIPDLEEGVADRDGDGIPDYLDISLDEDRDGLPDILEGTGDRDADGIADFLDVDSDNDGIPDYLEGPAAYSANAVDTDADGIPDSLDASITGGTDSNSNGIDDAYEPIDTDEDGIPDYLDVDSDGDGLPDRLEAAMVPLSGVDSDGDGIDDHLDADATGGADLNGDGVDDAFAPRDADRNGVPDHLQRDSDRDGVLDGVEGGAAGLDSDGDGIDDAFDPDQTGGDDADGDGIDDAAALRDSDADGVPDYRDLDSDNDTIGDALEAGLPDDNRDGFADSGATTNSPPDSDGDGTPDMRDTDSNNDGVTDIVATGNGLLDQNGDGRIDNITDRDGDGIPDVIDSTVGDFGGMLDTDGDGVPNSVDVDDDNDGIPDAVELAGLPPMSGKDSDGDGIDDAVDVSQTNGLDLNLDGVDDALDGDSDDDGLRNDLDLDSDNDGIPDLWESGIRSLIDANLDGRIDDIIDVDGNGGHDPVGTAPTVGDTDRDGIPDFLDLDSDGDTIFDLLESGRSITLDANNDGRIDIFVDLDRDGIADSVDAIRLDGSAGNLLQLVDSDNDGIWNFRDTDSDNDGFTDDLENGDFNSDGIPDHLQNRGGLNTGVRGGGAMDGLVLILMVFGAVAAGVPRRLKGRALGAVLLAGSLFIGFGAPPAYAHEDGNCGIRKIGCWYAGIGIGVAHLDPEGEVNGWSTAETRSYGFGVHLGQRFARRWHWELTWYDAGEAELENVNPALNLALPYAVINYEIPSLMIGYRILDGNRWGVYGRAGASALQTEASDGRITQELENSVQAALGLGLEYRPSGSGWAIGLDFTSYDRDASSAVLKLSRDFGR